MVEEGQCASGEMTLVPLRQTGRVGRWEEEKGRVGSGRGCGGLVRGEEGERWGGEEREAVMEVTEMSFFVLPLPRQALL